MFYLLVSLIGIAANYRQNHKVDQKLTCIGCHSSFYRACLFIEHLEFGHCDVISARQFQGHIVHKLLITELLDNNVALNRFYAKQAKYEAAMDYEEEGGIALNEEIFEDDGLEEVYYKAIKPDTPPAILCTSTAGEPFPPLPAQRTDSSTRGFEIATALDGMSLGSGSGAATAVNSPPFSPSPASLHSMSESMRQPATHVGSSSMSTAGQPKVWGSREGKSASSILFADAKPTPTPSEFSIAAYDERMEQSQGSNIMNIRFWDPTSTDFNPDRFYDAVVNMYNCPFTCE